MGENAPDVGDEDQFRFQLPTYPSPKLTFCPK